MNKWEKNCLGTCSELTVLYIAVKLSFSSGLFLTHSVCDCIGKHKTDCGTGRRA